MLGYIKTVIDLQFSLMSILHPIFSHSLSLIYVLKFPCIDSLHNVSLSVALFLFSPVYITEYELFYY